MALETLVVVPITRDGAEAPRVGITTDGGVKFPNNGKTLLFVLDDSGAHSLVFTIVPSIDGQDGLTRTVAITASEDWCIGPFPVDIYNDADGNVYFAPDGDLAASTVAMTL